MSSGEKALRANEPETLHHSVANNRWIQGWKTNVENKKSRLFTEYLSVKRRLRCAVLNVGLHLHWGIQTVTHNVSSLEGEETTTEAMIIYRTDPNNPKWVEHRSCCPPSHRGRAQWPSRQSNRECLTGPNVRARNALRPTCCGWSVQPNWLSRSYPNCVRASRANGSGA